MKLRPLRVPALGANELHRFRASEYWRSNAQAPALASLFLDLETASKLTDSHAYAIPPMVRGASSALR